jgi:hypothetical protein
MKTWSVRWSSGAGSYNASDKSSLSKQNEADVLQASVRWMGQLFLSYSRKDQDLVARVSTAVSRRTAQRFGSRSRAMVWVTPETCRPAGREYRFMPMML